jgi:hypothetical protein
MKNADMKKHMMVLLLIFGLISRLDSFAGGTPPPPVRELIELRIYHFNNAAQEAGLDSFFRDALLPALHGEGVKNVGVFKALANDTATDKKIYVLVPYKSFDQLRKISSRLSKNKIYNEGGAGYINAAYNRPLYARMETILLDAFEYMPSVAAPQLKSAKSERVYELRSYESSSEKIYRNKVDMFNKGGEVTLFKRLGFNAIFYGEVIAGASMPNLMYMTSFENRKSRDEHWKAFIDDPEWKKLSARKEYQNNVSKIDITFLMPAEYSDL